MKVAAVLDDISRYGEPDATSDGKVDLDWGKTQVTATGTIPLQAELHGAALKAQLQSKSLNDMLGFSAGIANSGGRMGGDLVRDGSALTLTLPRLTEAGATRSPSLGGAAFG